MAGRRAVGITCSVAVVVGVAAEGIAGPRYRVTDAGLPPEIQAFENDMRAEAPLMAAQVFSSTSVGYSGGSPQVASEFEQLMSDANAEDKLLALVDRGAPGAVMYGLCGLRLLGSPRFEAALSSVSVAPDRRFGVQRGCIREPRTVREFVRSKDFGTVCDEWKHVVGKARPSQSVAPVAAAAAAVGSKELVLTGIIRSIRLGGPDPKPWIVTVDVKKVEKGEFSGRRFEFAVHSPAQSGLKKGRSYAIKAVWRDNGYEVDERQWLRSR